MQKQEILFCGFNNPCYFLSNFYRHSFIAENIKWKTSEHYYQWKKMKYLQSLGLDISNIFLKKIINANTPKESKQLGHSKVPDELIKKWDLIKDKEMFLVLIEKFKDKKVSKLLLETGDKVLKEDSKYDSYWGIGKDGTGLNKLGLLLMNVRNKIKHDEFKQSKITDYF